LTKDFDFGEDAGEVIGRGTWIDKLALDVLKRKDNLEGIDKLALDVLKRKDNLAGKHPEVIRTESGLGASGFPHIGSFADASRAYGFKIALDICR